MTAYALAFGSLLLLDARAGTCGKRQAIAPSISRQRAAGGVWRDATPRRTKAFVRKLTLLVDVPLDSPAK